MSMQRLVAELAKWAADEVTPRPLNIVLRYLIDQIVEQGKNINQVEKLVGQHITNPFQNGLIYLEEATSAFDEQSRSENLRKAIDSFIPVARLDPTDFPMVAVKSQFYIGVCYELLGERNAAIRWYERSYNFALDELNRVSNTVKRTSGIFRNSKREKGIGDTFQDLQNFVQQISGLRLIGTIRRLSCKGPIYGLEFSPNGQSLISSSFKGKLTLWDIKSTKQLFQVEFKDENNKVNALGPVAFSPDGKFVAVAVYKQAIYICDAKNGKVTHRFGEGEETRALSFSPDGKFLASGSHLGVIIWEPNTGKRLIYLDGHPHPVDAVTFSHNGMLLASGANDGVKLWRYESSGAVGYYPLSSFALSSPEKIRVWSLAFSPDDTLLAVGGRNANVRIWSIKENQFIRNYEAGRGDVQNVFFSRDGSLLAASTALDVESRSRKAIRFWDVRSAKVFYDFVLDPVDTLSLFRFSPRGSLIAVGPDYSGDMLLFEFRYGTSPIK